MSRGGQDAGYQGAKVSTDSDRRFTVTSKGNDAWRRVTSSSSGSQRVAAADRTCDERLGFRREVFTRVDETIFLEAVLLVVR